MLCFGVKVCVLAWIVPNANEKNSRSLWDIFEHWFRPVVFALHHDKQCVLWYDSSTSFLFWILCCDYGVPLFELRVAVAKKWDNLINSVDQVNEIFCLISKWHRGKSERSWLNPQIWFHWKTLVQPHLYSYWSRYFKNVWHCWPFVRPRMEHLHQFLGQNLKNVLGKEGRD